MVLLREARNHFSEKQLVFAPISHIVFNGYFLQTKEKQSRRSNSLVANV